MFIKLFVRLFGEFIAFFKDAFAKQNPFVNPGGARRFMFGTVLGFALVWHIWWLAAAGLVGMVGSFIARAYDRDTDYWVSAAEVERIEPGKVIDVELDDDEYEIEVLRGDGTVVELEYDARSGRLIEREVEDD